MRVCFVLLAKGAAFYIAADIGSEAGPPEFSGDELASFQEARVSGGFMVMATLEDGTAEGVVCRDVDTALIGKDASFNLPVCEAGAEGEGNILMHGLEGLENEGISCGGGFNAVGEGSVDEIDKEGRREESDVGVVGIVRGEEVRAAREGVGASEKFPGTWTIFRSKSARSTSQRACRRLSAWGWRK